MPIAARLSAIQVPQLAPHLLSRMPPQESHNAHGHLVCFVETPADFDDHRVKPVPLQALQRAFVPDAWARPDLMA
jgi:hypothetical protein